MSKNLSEEELERIIERQDKIIANYESVSFFYNLLKKAPALGSFFRFVAGVLKGGGLSGIKVIDDVKTKNPQMIAVSNPEHRGVTSATRELVSDVYLISEIHNKKSAEKYAKKIAGKNPKVVLLSGYSKGYDLLAEEIKKALPAVRIFVFIHSAFVWFDIWKVETKVFENFLRLSKLGVIEKIGFCKRDLAVYFKELGYNSYFVMNRFYPEKHEFKTIEKDSLKVGVWGKNFWHRNITNQVVSALMVKNIEVHVNEIGDHAFLDRKRIRVHGFLSKEKFHEIFKQMDINLYVSLTECFPMAVIESMQYGIPCVVSDTSDVYSFDKKLKARLTVSTIDGPLGIKEKIEEVIKNYDEIQQEIKAYLPVLKKETEGSIKEFLK